MQDTVRLNGYSSHIYRALCILVPHVASCILHLASHIPHHAANFHIQNPMTTAVASQVMISLVRVPRFTMYST